MPLKLEWGRLCTGWQVKPSGSWKNILSCFSRSLAPWCPGCLGHMVACHTCLRRGHEVARRRRRRRRRQVVWSGNPVSLALPPTSSLDGVPLASRSPGACSRPAHPDLLVASSAGWGGKWPLRPERLLVWTSGPPPDRNFLNNQGHILWHKKPSFLFLNHFDVK